MITYVYGIYFFVLICVSGIHCQLYEGDRCFSARDKLNGTCSRVRNCLSAVYEIKMRQYPQLCSFNGTEPIICCTDCDLVDDASTVLVSKTGRSYYKTGQKAADKCLEYITRFDYNCTMRTGIQRAFNNISKKCYIQSESRHLPVEAIFISTAQFSLINFGIGGVDAYRGQYPHMALLGYGNNLDSAQWLCGGSVISDRFILTAAHCTVTGELGPIRFVGLGILKRTDPIGTWRVYKVKRTIPHPQYKSPSKYHDIALLEVSTKIKFNSYVLPACLDVEDGYEDRAVATGWGALGRRKGLADTLQAMELERFSAADCTTAYPANRNLKNGYNYTTQTCYGGDGKIIVDTCPGDSGGPLQIASSHGECVFNIIGVTSFGSPCGALGNAGVYTKVQHYVPWIEKIVWPS